MPRGFSLTELVAVLAIIAILSAMATPKLFHLHDTLAVDASARHIASAHRQARSAAITHRKIMALTITDDSLIVRTSARENEPALWSAAGPAIYGATLSAPNRRVTFSPIGLAIGASNATYTVTRGAARRSVVVSRLGRVRIR